MGSPLPKVQMTTGECFRPAPSVTPDDLRLHVASLRYFALVFHRLALPLSSGADTMPGLVSGPGEMRCQKCSARAGCIQV